MKNADSADSTRARIEPAPIELVAGADYAHAAEPARGAESAFDGEEAQRAERRSGRRRDRSTAAENAGAARRVSYEPSARTEPAFRGRHRDGRSHRAASAGAADCVGERGVGCHAGPAQRGVGDYREPLQPGDDARESAI